ncbi:synovial sarcoma translocation, Chromosome 18 [Cichlidogyrus casuarinus]|uniref:Synovial sarcoma translocation, Chromosome 18 n=1 Tax=Cichlidogyrus casuarinus TaxID=1844966 RepID=A0ABD2Q1C6_9PLAT
MSAPHAPTPINIRESKENNLSSNNIQSLLDENVKLIQILVNHKKSGSEKDVSEAQQILHKNLIHLATIADQTSGYPNNQRPNPQPNQVIVPAPVMANQLSSRMPSGHHNGPPPPIGEHPRSYPPNMGSRPPMQGPPFGPMPPHFQLSSPMGYPPQMRLNGGMHGPNSAVPPKTEPSSTGENELKSERKSASPHNEKSESNQPPEPPASAGTDEDDKS